MPPDPPAQPFPGNQVPPLVDHDPIASDPALRAGLAAAGSDIPAELVDLALRAGSARVAEWVRLAHANPPALRTHDRAGLRIDEVEFHPGWHELMGAAVGAGLHAAPWGSPREPAGAAETPAAGAHLRRGAGFYLWTQTESGHLCPISMTYSAMPTLRGAPQLAAAFEPGLTSRLYDPGLRPPTTKLGLLAGMSMTERRGGSDVRSNETVAVPVGAAASSGPDEYRLTGAKWFTSAPMNDLFLTLAQTPPGPTCFLVPRVLPDGSRNAMRLVRLKDKLGNRSNASAEIEYAGATGWRIGDEGRGVATILQMVTLTRVDCVLGSAGQVRAALSESAFYAAHRWAFGAALAGQPAMTAVLADLTVESWAATLMGMRLAALVSTAESPASTQAEAASLVLRLAVPVSKFWVCKRAVPVIAEALECLGGNGYVETYPMARLLREAPLNSIWEGSGTVTALDALRAVSRSGESVQAFLDEVSPARGGGRAFDAALDRLGRWLAEDLQPSDARPVGSLAARVFAASLLIRQAPPAVADLYCATRLGWPGGERVFGELPRSAGSPDSAVVRAIVDDVTPQVGG